MIETTVYHVELEFSEPVLGSTPMNPDIYKDFIESQKPEEQQEEEFKTVEAREERGWTGFRRTPDEGKKVGYLFTYDYTIRGYLKDALNSLKACGAHDLSASRSKIDKFVFVKPRQIPFLTATAIPDTVHGFDCPDGCRRIHHTPKEYLERPLRAETRQGPRVTLVRSDMLPVGTRLEFDLLILAPKMFTIDLLSLAFDRGEFMGFGQFRTGSYGRFAYKITKAEESAKRVKGVRFEVTRG